MKQDQYLMLKGWRWSLVVLALSVLVGGSLLFEKRSQGQSICEVSGSMSFVSEDATLTCLSDDINCQVLLFVQTGGEETLTGGVSGTYTPEKRCIIKGPFNPLPLKIACTGSGIFKGTACGVPVETPLTFSSQLGDDGCVHFVSQLGRGGDDVHGKTSGIGPFFGCTGTYEGKVVVPK